MILPEDVVDGWLDPKEEDTDKLFTGHQKEGDLYFMQSRFYDPTIGRFLSADTIVPSAAEPGAFNRYAYVYNNPLAYTDPTGHVGGGGGSNCATTYSCWNQPEEPEPQPQPAPPPPVVVSTPTPPPPPQEECGWCFWIDVGEVVITVAPFSGDALDVCMYVTGKDCLAWEDVPEWQQDLALASLLAPGGFARYSDEGLDATEAAARALRGADNAAELQRALPRALQGGPARVHVYFGVRDGERVYVGIADDLARRQAQHGTRFEVRRVTTGGAVTRGQARAIEEALIVDNPGFENARHSISPNLSYYQEAVDWGRAWLREHGY